VLVAVFTFDEKASVSIELNENVIKIDEIKISVEINIVGVDLNIARTWL
jgi:hypothetical protein